MKRKSEESKEQAQDGSKMRARARRGGIFEETIGKRMIHIEFVDTNRAVEVARPAGSYLSTMGVPGSKGVRHKLYPEETGAAYVTDKNAGNELTTAQLHGIALNLVPHTHFTAYREIRRSGLRGSSGKGSIRRFTAFQRLALHRAHFSKKLRNRLAKRMKNLAADDALNPVGHTLEAKLPLNPTLLRFSSLIARTATDWADYRKRALAAINNAREMRTRNSAR
ncbi:unnamed protein product, partial [Mesorhabditis spiculigera]